MIMMNLRSIFSATKKVEPIKRRRRRATMSDSSDFDEDFKNKCSTSVSSSSCILFQPEASVQK